jgi:multidrug efflux pump subunit AcrA (membrane-fusion protein)
VYRIDENNIAQRVVVTLGVGQGELVSVTGELSAGDSVAVRGVERLADGQEVRLPNSWGT